MTLNWNILIIHIPLSHRWHSSDIYLRKGNSFILLKFCLFSLDIEEFQAKVNDEFLLIDQVQSSQLPWKCANWSFISSSYRCVFFVCLWILHLFCSDSYKQIAWEKKKKNKEKKKKKKKIQSFFSMFLSLFSLRCVYVFTVCVCVCLCPS